MIVYKPIGTTCGEIIESLKHKYEFIAFAGRLDPMAHGDLLILTDKLVKDINFYNGLDKTYTFKFVIGLSTDSTDVLGIFNNPHYLEKIDLDLLSKSICNFSNHTYKQKYHKFSSFVPSNKINGKRKPSWWWSIHQPQTVIDLPAKTKTIFNIQIDLIQYISWVELKKTIIHNISLINKNNNLRQEEVLEQWDKFEWGFGSGFGPGSESSAGFESNPEPICEITCTATVSTGFYIRQFVQDLSDKFLVKMMCTDIFRKKFLI